MVCFDVAGTHTALPFILGRYSSCSVWETVEGGGVSYSFLISVEVGGCG